jgi:hypothetical protein
MKSLFRASIGVIIALILLFTFVSIAFAKPGIHDKHQNDDNGANQVALFQGWDIQDWPLNKGKVIWNSPDSTGKLQLTYILNGAKPNLNVQVGLIVVAQAGTQKSTMFTGDPFGINTGFNPNVTREGQTISATTWDIGYIQTDEYGDGSVHFNIYPNPGEYNVQFFIRKGNCLYLPGDRTGCSVTYESGGVFGTSVVATIE